MMEDFNFKAVEQEYIPTIDDDDCMLYIKESLFKLSEADRRIMLVYMDLQTYTGVAKFFGCSPPTAKKKIKQIIEKFK